MGETRIVIDFLVIVSLVLVSQCVSSAADAAMNRNDTAITESSVEVGRGS